MLILVMRFITFLIFPNTLYKQFFIISKILSIENLPLHT